jgi:hypothetical protein
VKRGKPLARRTPLKAGKPLKRTKWMRKAKRESAALTAARKIALQRSEARCEARWSNCTRQAEHAHHMRRRSQGGGDTPDNLLIVCSRCHTDIHANPAEAARRGHLILGRETP